MKIYTLHVKQKLPISKKEAWDFFSSPKNLSKITPESMDFKIISGAERKTYAGQIIQYRVVPMLGISTKWVSEITHMNEGEYFVDEQLYGPYAMWHHKHFVREIDNGVELEDLIHYKLPLGILGRMMHPIIVKPQLKKIFEYREKKLSELFGEYK